MSGAATKATPKPKAAANGNGANGAAPAHKTLAEALMAAQEEIPAIERDGYNPHFKSRFMTLGNLLGKTLPVLRKHGIGVIQLPTRAADGTPTLTTTFTHIATGETVTGEAPLLPIKADPQALGSAITYGRRYALAAALQVSDQDDDDGNAASEPERNATTQGRPAQQSERPATGKQKGLINTLAGKAGISEDELKALVQWSGGVAYLDRLSSKAASALIDGMGKDGAGVPDLIQKIRAAAANDDERAKKIAERYLSGGAS